MKIFLKIDRDSYNSPVLDEDRAEIFLKENLIYIILEKPYTKIILEPENLRNIIDHDLSGLEIVLPVITCKRQMTSMDKNNVDFELVDIKEVKLMEKEEDINLQIGGRKVTFHAKSFKNAIKLLLDIYDKQK